MGLETHDLRERCVIRQDALALEAVDENRATRNAAYALLGISGIEGFLCCRVDVAKGVRCRKALADELEAGLVLPFAHQQLGRVIAGSFLLDGGRLSLVPRDAIETPERRSNALC